MDSPPLPHALKQLANQVSRSFGLSLRLLPAPMAPLVTLAYLLARASDTIADTIQSPREERLAWLCHFETSLLEQVTPCLPASFCQSIPHPGEKQLLQALPYLFESFFQCSPPQKNILSTLLASILRGQKNDLQGHYSIHSQDTESGQYTSLFDYCYDVAGSVGIFWTQVGLHMLPDFSQENLSTLSLWAKNYGQALQLINILRDCPIDYAMDRCYLPAFRKSISPQESWEISCNKLFPLIKQGLIEGQYYARSLCVRRLKAATLLPALIGKKTLHLLASSQYKELKKGIKISRKEVYKSLFQALLS